MNDKKEKFGRNNFILMFFAFSFGMILSNLIAQQAEKSPAKAAPLFIYKGIDQSLDDVSHSIQKKLVKLEEERQHLLELAAIELHVHQYARDKAITLAEASQQLLPIEAVNDEDIANFYTANETQLARPFYEVKHSIKQRFQNQAIEKSKQQLLNGLIEKGDLAFSIN